MTNYLSAVVIVNNEEDNIKICLEALQKVTTDIVIVDSGSTDNTPAICEKMGARVFHYGWKGYAANKNFGATQCQNDWILSIDADEVLSEELIQKIKEISLQKNTVYSLDRITNYCGDWIHHSGWYPDWKPRIFNRNDVRWEGAYVHETLSMPSDFELQKLEGKLFHYSYKTSEDHLERIENYAELSAQKLKAAGKKSNFIKLYFSPLFKFFRTYIIKLGFLDGKSGWTISKRDAYLVWLKYQKLKGLWK